MKYMAHVLGCAVCSEFSQLARVLAAGKNAGRTVQAVQSDRCLFLAGAKCCRYTESSEGSDLPGGLLYRPF